MQRLEERFKDTDLLKKLYKTRYNTIDENPMNRDEIRL